MKTARATCLALLFALWGCSEDQEVSPAATGATAGTSGSGGSSGSGGTAGTAGTGGTAGSGGTSGASGTSGTAGTGGCIELTPGPDVLNFNAPGAWVSVEAKVNAPIDGYAKTRLSLEIYTDNGTPTPPDLGPGTFQLDEGFESSYGTCQHCVLLVAFDASSQARRVFFQTGGSMTLTTLNPDDFGVLAGTIADVTLSEFTQSQDFSWHPVEGSRCYHIESWGFDTRAVDGGPCNSAEDCPNESMQICDPSTKTCQPGQCSLTGDPPYCGAGQICLSQLGSILSSGESGPAIGACYDTCIPGDPAPCADGKICLPLGPTQATGICLDPGTKPVGEPCDGSDLSTGCENGAVCTGENPTCTKLCDYLTSVTGCPDGTYCTTTNVCLPLSAGDLAIIGEACNSLSPELTNCGAEGDSFRGICMRFFTNEPASTCQRLCELTTPACGPNEECLGIFSNPNIGVCHLTPTCGDGKVDVVGGEYCDDGNTTSGDGCNAQCTQAELGPLCSLAEPLLVGQWLIDTTENGPRGYASGCDPFVATPTKTYSFMPTELGRLTLELNSVQELGLSVLSDCEDNASELKCLERSGTTRIHLDVTSLPTKPWLVVVRGQSPLDEGQFGLYSTYTPANCGDGQVAGPEQCDDGNTTSGDGCSADCTAIEWPELCASLPTLTASQSGTLADGLTAFDTTGQCAFVGGGGRNRAFAYTAPSAGTLTLSAVGSKNLVVYVENGCGDVSTAEYLGCGNSASAGEPETSTVELTAGQDITVIVQGFSDTDNGTFTLTSSFTANP